MNLNHIDELISNAVARYAAGDHSGAIKFLGLLLKANPGNLTGFDLLQKIRTDFSSAHSKALLVEIRDLLRYLTVTTAQSYRSQLLADPSLQDPLRLERHGFSIASQNDEDGMLMEVFRRIGSGDRRFFEFGVGNGLQNITFAFLLQGWAGHWIEINSAKAQFIRDRFSVPIQSGRLTLGTDAVTAENIDRLTFELGVPEEIDLLSIDIDGNDYHVFEAMTRVKPRVVVLEYNPLYPPPMRVVMSYDSKWVYDANRYVGASLQSLTDLAEKKGYQLVGCSTSGINAIFVKGDLAADKFFQPASAERLYHQPRYQMSWSGAYGWGPKSVMSSFSHPDLSSPPD